MTETCRRSDPQTREAGHPRAPLRRRPYAAHAPERRIAPRPSDASPRRYPLPSGTRREGGKCDRSCRIFPIPLYVSAYRRSRGSAWHAGADGRPRRGARRECGGAGRRPRSAPVAKGAGAPVASGVTVVLPAYWLMGRCCFSSSTTVVRRTPRWLYGRISAALRPLRCRSCPSGTSGLRWLAAGCADDASLPLKTQGRRCGGECLGLAGSPGVSAAAAAVPHPGLRASIALTRLCTVGVLTMAGPRMEAADEHRLRAAGAKASSRSGTHSACR